MAEYIESLRNLAEKFGRLEGVGKKTAMRMAFSVLELDTEEAEDFARAILDAKEKIDRSVICVVTDARTVLAMEKVREYRGTYHVLHGLISPMNGITPEQLKIKELLARVATGEVGEVIVATNPTVEGEATAMYLSRLLQPFGIRVTRLAYGVPVGADLEYADEVTLYRALEGRRDVH